MLFGVTTLAIAWGVTRMRAADPAAPTGLVVAPLAGGAATAGYLGTADPPGADSSGLSAVAARERGRTGTSPEVGGAEAPERGAPAPRSAFVLRGPVRFLAEEEGGVLHVQDLSGLVVVRPGDVVETLRPADRLDVNPAEPETVLHLRDGRSVAIPDPVYEGLPKGWRYRADYVRESSNVSPSAHLEPSGSDASEAPPAED